MGDILARLIVPQDNGFACDGNAIVVLSKHGWGR